MNDEILIAYLLHTLNEKDCQAVEEWYMSAEENRRWLEQLYFTLSVGDRAHVFTQVDADKSFSELKRKITQRGRKNKTGKNILKYSWRIVAVAAAVWGGLILWNGISMMQSLSQPFTILTNIGERTQAILPDGSKVWVGACSKLAYYTPDLFTKERKIHLTGEAYFEVAKDDEHPFIVNSQQLQITVTGTRFNIRSNEDDRYITTTLLEGTLQITDTERGHPSITMNPWEQFCFDKEKDQGELYPCPTALEYIAWISGKQHFVQTPLNNIAASLERYYNIDIIITSETLKQEEFTCDFETTENIYQIFSVLKLTNKVDYKIHNRTIELLETPHK